MGPPAGALRATSRISQRVRRPRRRTADPARDRQRGRVRRLRGAQWDRRGSSDHGRTRVHRGACDHQRASRARRRPPSCLPKTVDPGQQTITFDLIQFFTGEAATKAAAEDGQESPPPNDYYIRNVNSRLRTLPVRSGAPITECARRRVHWQLDQGRLGDPGRARRLLPEQRDSAVLDPLWSRVR